MCKNDGRHIRRTALMTDLAKQDPEALRAAIILALDLADNQEQDLVAAMLSDALYFVNRDAEHRVAGQLRTSKVTYNRGSSSPLRLENQTLLKPPVF